MFGQGKSKGKSKSKWHAPSNSYKCLLCWLETKRDVATRSSEALSRRSRTPARSSGVGIKVTRAKGLGSPVRKALALTLQLYLWLSSCTERRNMFDMLCCCC